MHEWRARKADALGGSRTRFALHIWLSCIAITSIMFPITIVMLFGVLVCEWRDATTSECHLIFTFPTNDNDQKRVSNMQYSTDL